MGVPKFYRWISERYPCLSQVLKEHQMPEFDNLYLDMNGIIHACSHPNDDDPHFRISEEKIFCDIFHYIEVLFRIIKPHKLFFMAVDGVAPRAKMNQQRGRRFRSAKEAETLEKKAREKGEILPDVERFDSNCITPGTAFMARLNEQLMYFINSKITNDKTWQSIEVILSGHETPGEGEHKIMDYIRWARSQKNYDPNTRHCLYGLDADLIMLALCSHEPHFALLREEVKFTRQSNNSKKSSDPEQTTFHLLHISLLREYMELEFHCLKSDLSFEFSLEKIIDDWVLMGFLVGNDFIPNLPNLHINQDALPLLFNTYKKVLPTLDGYINEGGQLNLKRFQLFMVELANFDYNHFLDEYDDFMWLQGKGPMKKKNKNRDIRKLEEFNDFEEEAFANLGDFGTLEEMSGISKELQTKIAKDEAELDVLEKELEKEGEKFLDIPALDEEEWTNHRPSDWTEQMEAEFRHYKAQYYREKLEVGRIDYRFLKNQALEFVTAIQWNLHYYYNGIVSWGWYYPQHYAPFVSDIINFDDESIEFDLGTPFLPFQQLLAVLPAASRKHLPNAYQDLMTSAQSPIKDYYPLNFATDLNGKQNDWEAVVLIPFIDEQRLLAAMSTQEDRLTDEERSRNRHSGPLSYVTGLKNVGTLYKSSLPDIFPDIIGCRADCRELDINIHRISRDKIVKGILPGVDLQIYLPGFSTLRHLPFEAELRLAGVQVFQACSKHENMILTVADRPEMSLDLETISNRLIGKEVHCGWPHLFACLVVSVCDSSSKFFIDHEDNNSVKMEPMSDKAIKEFEADVKSIRVTMESCKGIALKSDITNLIAVRPLLGKKYHYCSSSDQMIIKKQWSQELVSFPSQVVIEDVQVEECEKTSISTLEEMFPEGCEVFLLLRAYYGCSGIVGNNVGKTLKSRVFVEIVVENEPNFERLLAKKDKIELFYWPGWQMAQRIGVGSHFLSRITGTVYMLPRRGDKTAPKINIGLNLKFNKKNEEVVDYTKKDGAGQWLYSLNVENVLRQLVNKFPEIVQAMHNEAANDDIFYANEVFKGQQDSQSKFRELEKFVKQFGMADSNKLQRQTAGTETVDERMIAAIEREVQKWKDRKYLPTNRKIVLELQPQHIYRAHLNEGQSWPDEKADFQLYDRVVNVRDGYVVPIGLHGTVVGIHTGDHLSNLFIDVIFDDEFLGGIRLRNSRASGYQLPACSLINITYGRYRMTTKRAAFEYVDRPTSTQMQILNHISTGFSQNKSNGTIPKNDLNLATDVNLLENNRVPKRNSKIFNNSAQAVNPENLNRSYKPLNNNINQTYINSTDGYGAYSGGLYASTPRNKIIANLTNAPANSQQTNRSDLPHDTSFSNSIPTANLGPSKRLPGFTHCDSSVFRPPRRRAAIIDQPQPPLVFSHSAAVPISSTRAPIDYNISPWHSGGAPNFVSNRLPAAANIQNPAHHWIQRSSTHSVSDEFSLLMNSLNKAQKQQQSLEKSNANNNNIMSELFPPQKLIVPKSHIQISDLATSNLHDVSVDNEFAQMMQRLQLGAAPKTASNDPVVAQRRLAENALRKALNIGNSDKKQHDNAVNKCKPENIAINYVEQLAVLSAQIGYPSPFYKLKVANGTFACTVQVGNIRWVGSECADENSAQQSAAYVALLNIGPVNNDRSATNLSQGHERTKQQVDPRNKIYHSRPKGKCESRVVTNSNDNTSVNMFVPMQVTKKRTSIAGNQTNGQEILIKTSTSENLYDNSVISSSTPSITKENLIQNINATITDKKNQSKVRKTPRLSNNMQMPVASTVGSEDAYKDKIGTPLIQSSVESQRVITNKSRLAINLSNDV